MEFNINKTIQCDIELQEDEIKAFEVVTGIIDDIDFTIRTETSNHGNLQNFIDYYKLSFLSLIAEIAEDSDSFLKRLSEYVEDII